ncbi:MAG: tetratricopeptide repeat protein [Candidatus Eisenbacteria bacterium]
MPGRAADSGEALEHYVQGMAHAEQGDLPSAIDELRAAAALDSAAGDIQRELARVLLQAGRASEAVSVASRARSLSPEDTEALWLLGEALSRSGRREEGIEALREARGREPDDRRYLNSLLLALEIAGKTEEALDLLLPEKGGVDPDVPPLLLRRGILRARLGQFDEALEDLVRAEEAAPGLPGAIDPILALAWKLGPSPSTAGALERVLAADPSSTQIRRELARILVSIGRQAEAQPLLERLRQEVPDDASIPMQLGVIHFSQERIPEAISCFRQARALDPHLADSGEWLWRAYLRADSLQAALSVADELARENPKDDAPLRYRAATLAQLDRPEEALQSLEQVHARNPDDREARLLSAGILLDLGRPEEARKHLEQILRMHPDDREVLFELGRIDETAGRYEDAVTWFARLLESHPGDASVLNYAGYLCADQGIRLDQALEWTRQAVSLDPGNAAYLDSYGWALFRLGRIGEAIEQLQRASQLDPREAEIRIHLARALHAGDRAEEGRQILRDLLRDQPDDRRARELLQVWEDRRSGGGNPR